MLGFFIIYIHTKNENIDTALKRCSIFGQESFSFFFQTIECISIHRFNEAGTKYSMLLFLGYVNIIRTSISVQSVEFWLVCFIFD